MISWYIAFMLGVVLLWAFSAPRDRIALRIVLIATLGSFLLTEGVTRHIHGEWKLVIPGAVETATIASLLYWARNRTGYMQAFCLMIAWYAHVLCYADLMWGTNMIYDQYERVLGVVAIGQIAACYETFHHNLRRLGRWLGSLPPRRLGDIRPASVSANLLRNPRP